MTYLYIYVEKKQRDCQTARFLALLLFLHVRTSALSYRYLQFLIVCLPHYTESTRPACNWYIPEYSLHIC